MSVTCDIAVRLNLSAAREIAQLLSGEIDERMQRACEFAKQDSPVDTGYNRDSIEVQGSMLDIRLVTKSGYGGWLEIGSQGRPARPYMVPAVERAFRD